MNTNWYSIKYIISEEDPNGLLQFHTGTAFLQMMVMAVFKEKENLCPRPDQINFPFSAVHRSFFVFWLFLNIPCFIQIVNFSFQWKQII